MALHSTLTGADIHALPAFTYADEAARNAATGFTSADLGKLAWQQDDDTFYILVSASPAQWVLVSAQGVLTLLNKVEVHARKASSGTLLKGQVVYVSGYDLVNGVALCELAKADSASTMPAAGIMREQATDSVTGKVLVVGVLDGVDTDGISVQSPIYVSAAVAGEFTDTPPSGPYVVQALGFCTYEDASDGYLGVSVQSYRALSNTAPANVTKATASEGTANECARRDHKHDVTTAAPVAVGTANAEGTATSLARSDHVHAPLTLFGDNAQDEVSETESSTSSENWIQKVRITTPSLPAGRYRIGWNYEWQYGSASRDELVQVELDDTTVLMAMVQEPADAGTDQWNPKGGFAYADLTAGAHTIDMDYRAGNSLYSAHIRRARLEIWRIS